MRNPDGESPRGPGDPPPEPQPEPHRSPLDRPDWWAAQPKVPWYRQVSRKQLYWTFAAIAFIHVMALLGFMADVKMDPIDQLRRHQKQVRTYALLPACQAGSVISTLTPRAPLLPPPGLAARNLTGSVGLGIQLDGTGKVADVCLQQGSIDAGFDTAVYAAARSWQFAPTPQNQSQTHLVRITFDDPAKPATIAAFVVDRGGPPPEPKQETR